MYTFEQLIKLGCPILSVGVKLFVNFTIYECFGFIRMTGFLIINNNNCRLLFDVRRLKVPFQNMWAVVFFYEYAGCYHNRVQYKLKSQLQLYYLDAFSDGHYLSDIVLIDICLKYCLQIDAPGVFLIDAVWLHLH